MDLCQYKNALGEPHKGVHSRRFMGLAIVDVLATIVCAAIIAFVWKLSFVYTAIILFVAGIVLHRLFCVRTTIDKMLFPVV